MDQGVISSRFPYLPNPFEMRQQAYQVEALIDTGFDGGVAVPPWLLENLGPPDSHELWEPVVVFPVLAPAYRGSFEVGSLGPFPVTITALGDEVLGMSILVFLYYDEAYHGVTAEHSSWTTLYPSFVKGALEGCGYFPPLLLWPPAI